MSSNPEKCGRAGGWEEWEERPRGATVRRWETERGWEEEGGWMEEVLAGSQGLPVLGPLLGKVVPGLGGTSCSSERSRGYPSAISLWVAPVCYLSLGGHRSQCHPSLGAHQP